MKTKMAWACMALSIAFGGLTTSAQQDFQTPINKAKSKDWIPLLDKELSYWEVWTGVPEPSVQNLPPNYQRAKDGKSKAPIGLGDPMHIYTVTQNNSGEYVLNISGLIYAGLTSKKEYSNYHLTFLFKWGEKKYEPRLNRKRDNGLLYHCHGEHGAFWKVWKSSLEYQIQEGDFGDLYTLAGTKARVTIDEAGKWDPNAETLVQKTRSIRRVDAESPHGEWTRIDLYVFEDTAVHVTNGEVVLALTNARSKEGKKLDKGQIQLQSESAECYMKDMHIRPISKLPRWIKRKV